MPCNKSGFTNIDSVRGWSTIDFDWSNAKEIWDKHTPMDDEELLYQQVQVRQGGARLRALIAARRSPLPPPTHTRTRITQMTTSASPGTTVWVYRCSVYACACTSTAAPENAPPNAKRTATPTGTPRRP